MNPGEAQYGEEVLWEEVGISVGKTKSDKFMLLQKGEGLCFE